MVSTLHNTQKRARRRRKNHFLFSAESKKSKRKKNIAVLYAIKWDLGKVSVSIFTRAFRVLIEHYPIRHAVNATWLSMIRHIFMVFFTFGYDWSEPQIEQGSWWDWVPRDPLGFSELRFSMNYYGIWHQFWCHLKWEQEKESKPSLDFGENEGEYLLLLDRYGLFSMDPFLIDHLCAFRLPKKVQISCISSEWDCRWSNIMISGKIL